MGQVVAVALKWVEVVVNVPTEWTFHSDGAALLSGVDGLGFIEISAPIDNRAPLNPRHFRAVIPDGTAGLRGQTTVVMGPGAEPGMVLDFTGTGNQPVRVSVHNDAVGEVVSFHATELLSNFALESGAHIGEMDLNLQRVAPQLAEKLDIRTLKLRAKLIPAESRVPVGGLLEWLRSPLGDRARKAVPGIASALRHNANAAQLGGKAWISEIELALLRATAFYMGSGASDASAVEQLEQLLAAVLVATRSRGA